MYGDMQLQGNSSTVELSAPSEHQKNTKHSTTCPTEAQESASPVEESLELFLLAVPDPPAMGDTAAPQQQGSMCTFEHQDALPATSSIATPANATVVASDSRTCEIQRHEDHSRISTSPDPMQRAQDTLGSQSTASTAVQLQSSASNAAHCHAQIAAARDTCDLTYTVAPLMPPPGADAAPDEKMEFLQQQLDSFAPGQAIIDDLLSLGSSDTERRQGGVGPTYSRVPLPWYETPVLNLIASCYKSCVFSKNTASHCILFVQDHTTCKQQFGYATRLYNSCWQLGVFQLVCTALDSSNVVQVRLWFRWQSVMERGLSVQSSSS